MAWYIYSTYVGGDCGINPENPKVVQCVALQACKKDIKRHLSFFKVHDSNLVPKCISEFYAIYTYVSQHGLADLFAPTDALTGIASNHGPHLDI